MTRIYITLQIVNFHNLLNTYILLSEVIDIMKITVIRNEPTKEVLQNIYDVLNRNIKNPKCFYTSEETKKLKKDKSNVWL